MEKKKLAPGKGAFYLNANPKNPNSPRYSGKVRQLDGTLVKVSIWFNGTAGQEGFNLGIALEAVDESAEAQQQQQRQQQQGWNSVKQTLQEGQPPQQQQQQQVQFNPEEDDVPI